MPARRTWSRSRAAAVVYVRSPCRCVRPLVVRDRGAWSSPTSGGCTTGPTPTAGRGAMFVGVPRRRWPWRRQHRRTSTPMFDGSSEPLGVVLAASVDLRRRPARRPPRGVGAGQAGRAGARRPASCRSLGVTMFFFRVPFVGHVRRCRPTWRRWSPCCGWSGMANAVNLIDGLDGLAAGIVAIAAGAFFLYGDRLVRRRPARRRTTSARWSPSIVLRHVRRLPAPQLPPGQDLHGRRRRPAARPADGGVDDRRRRPHRRPVQRPDLLLLRPAVHPVLHPRRADPRHRVRHRPPGAAGRAWRSPTRSTSTTGSCGSATATAGAC